MEKSKHQSCDIRLCNDASQAFDIAKKLPEFFNADGLKQIESDLESHVLYGAYSGEDMIAFVTYKEVNPETVEMSWLGVLPEMQRKGVGERLVTQTLEELSSKYKVCEVKTLSETEPYEPYRGTRAFYKRMGFIAIETINPYPGWEGNPCQIFVKFIGELGKDTI